MRVGVAVTSIDGRFDIVICGGGLSGLAFARQLALRDPALTIAVVDKLTRPLPVAAFKVGESTVEASGYYLRETLQLGAHLAEQQFRKCGLRYFFGDASGRHEDRPEFGLSRFPSMDSYQIDRGVLEEALRTEMPSTVTLLEGCSVNGFSLGASEEDHHVEISDASGVKRTLRSRWMIDATGRRRLLQRSLDIPRARAVEAPFHAAWFRVPGRIDVDDFVPAENTAWHARTTSRVRYYSTNHLMGQGYWVWLIPLASGFTSVGVVVHGGLHEFESIRTYDRCTAWIAAHEPTLARVLAGTQPADFLAFKDYSYSSPRVFSADRWACIGEAGLFADPFYSPGMWQIALSNSIASTMILDDRRGQPLTASEIDKLNDYYVQVNDEVTRSIQSTFEYSQHAGVTGLKLLWDFVTGWALTGTLVINGALTDRTTQDVGLHADRRFWHLSRVVRALLSEWGQRASGKRAYDFVDYRAIPFVLESYERTLAPGRNATELAAAHHATMEMLEELAQAIFVLALEDVMPEALATMPQPLWLNAWAIGLDPSAWERRGLRKPIGHARDISRVLGQLREAFQRSS